MASVQPPATGGGTEGDDEACLTEGWSSSDIGRAAKRPALQRDKFALPRDIIAKVLSFLDSKDRLRTRLVCKEWASVNKETGWECVNLRFLPDPPRDGVRDQATLFRRAEARARWLADQNHTVVKRLHISPIMLCPQPGCQASRLLEPVIPKMANALRVLEIRIMPGERADFALPFEYLELLSPLRNLEELSVQVTGATNILEPFCTFPNLRILEIRSMDGRGAACLPAELTRLQKLEGLIVENVPEYEDPKQVVTRMPQLRCFEMKESRHIRSPFASTSLARLHIDHDGYENEAQIHPLPLGACPALKELICSPLFGFHVRDQLTAYTSIVQLETDCYLGAPSLQELSELASLKSLRLDLPEEGTARVDIAAALTNLTNLQVLNIKNMAEIRGFENLPSLRMASLYFSLRFSKCRAEVKSKTLETLELAMTQHPDACTLPVPPLSAEIIECPRLHTIVQKRQEKRRGDVACWEMKSRVGFSTLQICQDAECSLPKDVTAYGVKRRVYGTEAWGPPVLNMLPPAPSVTSSASCPT